MKKTTKKKAATETLVNFILDKSGSMGSIKDATISGFNEYLETLKRDGNKYSFSLVLFDTEVTKRYVNRPIEDANKLDMETYTPGGMTALYDAVCTTIQEVHGNVNDKQKVLTVIMTDGEENSSKEYTSSNLRDLIKSMEKTGNWSFVFLGANQDSWANASKMGIPQMNTANFVASSAGMQFAMRSMAQNTSAFACNAGASTSSFFTAKDQFNMENVPTNNMVSVTYSSADGINAIYSVDNDGKISKHFSELGKKSWDKRKKDLLK